MMGELIQQIAGYGQQVIDYMWLPLLIWTICSGLFLLMFRFVKGVHPQYQYLSRLGLLFSLPAGFIALSLIQYGATLVSAPAESLSLISVSAPFELTVSANSTESLLTTSNVLYSTAFLIFVTGLILFAIRNLIQWFHLMRLKSNCSFLPIQYTDGLDYTNLDLIAEARKQIRISFLDQEIIPVTFGISNPVILLPSSLKSDPEKLNLVLQHELTHIRQNDFLSNVIITLTQILFWFHPLVHFLKRELIDYREIRCDSLVLSHKSVSRKKYASLLLELLPMPNITQELSVNMAQESSNLKKRIQMITQQKQNRPIPKRSSAAIFAFIIFSTVVAMSCTDMQTQGEETANSDRIIETQSGEDYYEVVEQMPELIGGLESILTNINYPEEAKENGIEGRVFVKFIVNKEGFVEDAEIMRGIGGGADEEALRVVREAKFEPGYQNGEPVRVQYALPITFRLGTPASDENPDQVFEVVDEMPELIGGFEGLREKIRYPEEAKQAGIEGRVFMQFIVNKQGNVEDAKVDRGIGYGADEEALRVIRQAKFEPGFRNGEPVRVQYSIAIAFVLPQEES